MTLPISRRNLLKLSAAASATSLLGCSTQAKSDGWDKGQLQHILPLASHNSFNIKVSFTEPQSGVKITLNGNHHTGVQEDSAGRFFSFVITGLDPATQYTLKLLNLNDESLCDSWPLKSLPALNADVEKLTLACFTCAGGPGWPVIWDKHGFKPVTYRKALFDILLKDEPDVVIANGDHIYWDFHSWVENREGWFAKTAMQKVMDMKGGFDETLPVMGTLNEETLINIADEQLASIYGVAFRSTPVLFITDDHDYFDNDDSTPEKTTFPPNNFHQDLRDTLQRFYFPEFIVQSDEEKSLPGVFEKQGAMLSKQYGRLRFGKLLDTLLYDCGGAISLDGENAGLVPKSVEDWLITQTQHETTRHLIHAPSHPMGWTAGKWREWYPDLLESSGTLLAQVDSDNSDEKYNWQSGWWHQHQRLCQSMSAQKKRKAICVSGDLHLLGSGTIEQSGDLDLSSNPVVSILSGPVGVGDLGWLSRARGVTAEHPKGVNVDNLLKPVERNGYTLLQVNQESIQVQQFQCPTGLPEAEMLTVEEVVKFTI